MKFFRYRKPSLKTLLGLTKLKKQVKKDLGVYEVTKITNAPENLKRRVLRKVGYYSKPMQILRNGVPKPGGAGCMSAMVVLIMAIAVVVRIVI